GNQAGAQIRKELTKMLKDAKNVDYLDQVYYALAELEIKEGNEAEAIRLYHKSVWSNTTNLTQKGISYLALASHYYSKNDFVPAGCYYDSCSQSLPDTYQDYKKITEFAEDVRSLAENISITLKEDSLQRVAKMPQPERDKLIDGMIAEAVKKAEAERLAAEEERMNVQSGRMKGMNTVGGMNNRGTFGGLTSNPAGNAGLSSTSSGSELSGSSNWYFYNQAAISYGSIEFVKFWGRRKLEDNWRRSNKKVISEADDLSTEGETGEISTPAAGAKSNKFQPTQREFYLNELPMNDTLMRESNQRIAQAYLNAGKIFKDELHRPNEAIEYFDRLNKRFPEDEKLLFSYYNMYQIYTALKIDDQIKYYKDLILQKFPESRSAKIISNPNYFKELDEERTTVMKFYENTYRNYNGKAYASVLSDCAKADTAFKVNPIRDKFGLLRIMAYAKQNPADTAGLVKSINDLIFKYPDSEVADPAKNLLSYIQKGPSSGLHKGPRKMQIGRVEEPKEKVAGAFFADNSSTHFYITMVSAANVDIGKLKFRISNFNVEKYNEDFFEVSSSVFDDQLQIITVKNFTNKKGAMDYYKSISLDDKVYEGMKETEYRHFVITKDNFTRLFKNKNVFDYFQFFTNNYLKE
ncbi:MAG: hypothetical protein PHY99_07415, partial [Bacteroidales bacterium]|nr:hypothetical protein [Bacteroidales bacterium]